MAMVTVIGTSALLLFARASYALPAVGDGLETESVTSSSVHQSDFTWISSWATTTTGMDHITYSPYLGQQSQSASRSSAPESASISPNSPSVTSRIIIPIVVVILVALLAGSIVMLLRWRRKRALRAHRRRSSWMASNKFKWHSDTKAPFEDTAHGAEALPPYPSVPPPGRVTTHERKLSIL